MSRLVQDAMRETFRHHDRLFSQLGGNSKIELSFTSTIAFHQLVYQLNQIDRIATFYAVEWATPRSNRSYCALRFNSPNAHLVSFAIENIQTLSNPTRNGSRARPDFYEQACIMAYSWSNRIDKFMYDSQPEHYTFAKKRFCRVLRELAR